MIFLNYESTTMKAMVKAYTKATQKKSYEFNSD